MQQQNYANHIRYYTPHHFLFYPLAAGLLALSIGAGIKSTGDGWLWISIISLWIMLIFLSFMVRQHYALTCQNRIVRMEMRFRYFTLTQQRLDLLESQLSFEQIAALRFASDEELPALLRSALNEHLTPDQIKKSIKNWVADDMRV